MHKRRFGGSCRPRAGLVVSGFDDERGGTVIDPAGVVISQLSLHQLIRSRMDARGWSYSDLERRSDRALSRGRWQQLGSGVPQRKFPDPISLTVIARVLDVDITTVVLAAAQAVGLEVRPRTSDLGALLPPGTDLLSERMRDAILALVRAAVADLGAEPGAAEDRTLLLEQPTTM